jgi:hypothetical protein
MKDYTNLPGVVTLRPDEWFLVEPDGTVHQGSPDGWRRLPDSAALRTHFLLTEETK